MSDFADARPDLAAAMNTAVADAIAATAREYQVMVEGWTGMVNFTTMDGARGWTFIDDPEMLHIANRAMIQFMSEYQAEVSRLNIHDHLINLPDDDG